MKKWQIIVVIVTGLVTVGLAGCGIAAGSGGTTNQQLSLVRKGALSVSVSGTGNIEPSEEAWLTFGSNGRIGKIYVEEGDPVSEGEILAQLDTDTLELAKAKAHVELIRAEVTLSEAQLALNQRELTRQTAEFNLSSVWDKKHALELALLKAQTDLRTAEHHLDETRDIYTWPEIEVAEDDVDDAKAFLQYVIDMNLPEATLAYAQARLDAAEAKLDAMVRTYDTEEVAIAKMQLEVTKMAEIQAENKLDKLTEEIVLQELRVEIAKNSVEQARESLQLAWQSMKLAEKSLGEVQRQLDEATLTAPFAGAIANVIVKEGNMVPLPNVSPMPVIQLVNYDRMELLVEMDEIDIPEVKLNQTAIINVDSLPGVNFEGKVSSIYPTPTVVGGVVLYKTKIGFDVPEDSGIKVGMSAVADIIVSIKENVVLVPKQAIEISEQEGTQVSVIVKNRIQKKTVVIGMSDGLYTEILSGVSEGESVLINTAR
jgi:HlyD family secretion protein